MKISNILFVSFLIFLFGGITFLCVGSKYYVGVDDRADFVKQEKLLSPFSVVVAEPSTIFSLKSEKENKITQTYLKNTLPDIGSFLVRNDTLFISSVQLKKDQVRHTRNLTYVSCLNVKSIIIKENSNVRMEKFKADSLRITMNKSELTGELNKTVFVSLISQDSYVRFRGDNIKKLQLQLDKTDLNIDSDKSIENVLGSLRNKSMLNCSIDGKLNLQKDKSSQLFF